MCARWVSTVRTDRYSCSAISALVCPSAISRRTSSSRSERSSGGPGGRLGGHPRAQPRVQIAFVGGRAPYGLHELVVGGLLEHVPDRAGAERVPRERRLLLHRQHDDLRLRRLRADIGDRLQARAAGHVQIEHEHIRGVTAHIASRAVEVTGLGNHFEPGLAVEQQSQATAHDGVIVGEHDPDCLHRGCLAGLGAALRRSCLLIWHWG